MPLEFQNEQLSACLDLTSFRDMSGREMGVICGVLEYCILETKIPRCADQENKVLQIGLLKLIFYYIYVVPILPRILCGSHELYKDK